jgi:hypothetical protein
LLTRPARPLPFRAIFTRAKPCRADCRIVQAVPAEGGPGPGLPPPAHVAWRQISAGAFGCEWPQIGNSVQNICSALGRVVGPDAMEIAEGGRYGKPPSERNGGKSCAAA